MTPLRLSVMVEAPIEAIADVLRKHAGGAGSCSTTAGCISSR